MKKNYNGLDLLKFIMALMVVMIHVKPNAHSLFLTTVFSPLMSISVPVFFVVSSVLLFSKLGGGAGYTSIIKYIKRIVILYISWLIIDGWFIIVRKPYIDMGFLHGSVEFIKDLIFGTTFPGSWYLSATVMGVLIVYTLSRVLNKYIVFLITFCIALYVSCVNSLPEIMWVPYDWYATHLRKEVNLSFPAQMVWISIGYIISYWLIKMQEYKKILIPLSIVLFGCGFVIQILSPSLVSMIIMVLTLFTFCFLIDLPDSELYKRIRNYSILMFFFHFSIAGKMGLFCNIVGDTLLTNWLYYLLVVAISVIFAEAILRLENIKYFKFLKCIH